MATHFSAETDNATSTPEAILASSPVTVYVTGVFGSAVLTAHLSNVTDGTYNPEKQMTAAGTINIVANGFVKFEISNVSATTSLTVLTVS